MPARSGFTSGCFYGPALLRWRTSYFQRAAATWFVAALAAAIAISCCLPRPALASPAGNFQSIASAPAATTPSCPSVVFGFGTTYAGGGRRHMGLDVSFAAESAVRSAVAGRVRFSGLVPSVGQDARIGAVSVEVASGAIVTLSPVDSRLVSTGETVAMGDLLGTVASSGDHSCDEPHLHLSERVDDRYVDPSHLVAAWLATYPTTATQPKAEVAERGATAAAPVGPTLGSRAGRTSTSSVRVPSGGVVIRQPAFVPLPVPESTALYVAVPSLGLVLSREIALHPAANLGSEVAARRTSAAAEGVGVGGETSAATAVTTRLASALADISGRHRYFGGVLFILAAGMGFALHNARTVRWAKSDRRMDSAFAVRGIRW